jgi:3-oxoadipate enol-lactonase
MLPTKRWQSWQNGFVLPRHDWQATFPLGSQLLKAQSWGQGEPLLLVPGLAGGLPLMAPLVRQLSQDFQVIGIEVREEHRLVGHRPIYSLLNLADDLVEAMDRLKLEAPTVLGVSFGGVLAMEAALRQPSRIGRLILQGVGSHFENGLIPKIAQWVLPNIPLPTDKPAINQFFNLLFGKNWPDRDLFNAAVQQCWQTDQGVMCERLNLARRFDWRGRLSKLAMPVLALRGDRDVMVSHPCWQDLGKRLPTAYLRELQGAGHMAFATHPDQIAQEVARFAAKVYLAA